MNLVNRKMRRSAVAVLAIIASIFTVTWLFKSRTHELSENSGSDYLDIHKREAQIEIPYKNNLEDDAETLNFPKNRKEEIKIISPLIKEMIAGKAGGPRDSYLRQFTDSKNDYERETVAPIIVRMKYVINPDGNPTKDDLHDYDYSVVDFNQNATPDTVTQVKDVPNNHPEEVNPPDIDLQRPVDVKNTDPDAYIQRILEELDREDAYHHTDIETTQVLTTNGFVEPTTKKDLYDYEIYTTPRFLYDYSSTLEIVIPNPRLIYDEYPLNF